MATLPPFYAFKLKGNYFGSYKRKNRNGSSFYVKYVLAGGAYTLNPHPAPNTLQLGRQYNFRFDFDNRGLAFAPYIHFDIFIDGDYIGSLRRAGQSDWMEFWFGISAINGWVVGEPLLFKLGPEASEYPSLFNGKIQEELFNYKDGDNCLTFEQIKNVFEGK